MKRLSKREQLQAWEQESEKCFEELRQLRPNLALFKQPHEKYPDGTLRERLKLTFSDLSYYKKLIKDYPNYLKRKNRQG
jgi:hypothetical protein|tara:strand:- start:397 stop:633 length:237 start_codon:yes stop_codon:yes gene_type:complete